MYLKVSAFTHEQCQIPLQSSYTALYLSYLIECFWILSSSNFQSFKCKNPLKLKILFHVPHLIEKIYSKKALYTKDF